MGKYVLKEVGDLLSFFLFSNFCNVQITISAYNNDPNFFSNSVWSWLNTYPLRGFQTAENIPRREVT